ncbi:MAG: P1 family peptidase [Coriobacteriia bacterium]|nr:P1 family peptidase [Coriobacteriia bacterium]
MSELLGLQSGSAARLPNGVLIGHHEDLEGGSGCTVLIYPEGATGAVSVRGSAPATRETDLLDPVNTVDVIHAVVLSGGSAFGLDSASGVMSYLREEGIGLAFAGQCVPIVSAACIFDLLIGKPVCPNAAWGEAAAASAGHRISTGNVGAGTGASVGKLLGIDWATKSGLGAASVQIGDLVIAVIAVVNALGSVSSGPRSRLLAGVRDPLRPLSLLDPYQVLLGQASEAEKGLSGLLTNGEQEPGAQAAAGQGPDGQAAAGQGPDGQAAAGQEPGQTAKGGPARQNTTISCIVTNAVLNKPEATRVANMAHDGYARAIEPVHTANDGDAVFALATNKVQVPSDIVGILAARITEAAIINAVVDAEPAFGLPASRDLL